MARTTLAEKKRRSNGVDGNSFDVTCVVGTIELGDGQIPAHVAAMQLIGEHDAQGVFSFPMADGRTQRVTVEFVGPVGDDGLSDSWTDSV